MDINRKISEEMAEILKKKKVIPDFKNLYHRTNPSATNIDWSSLLQAARNRREGVRIL